MAVIYADEKTARGLQMMQKKICLAMLLASMMIFLPRTVDAQERDERDFVGAAYNAIVVNCNEWISLRYAPSADSVRMAEIPLGTVVVVYDGPVWGIDGFYPVEYAGMRGYCLKEYLAYHSGGGAPRKRH